MIYDFLFLPDLLFFGEHSDLAYSDFCNSAKSERGCGDFTAKLICAYIVRTRSKLATSCGGQLLTPYFRRAFGTICTSNFKRLTEKTENVKE